MSKGSYAAKHADVPGAQFDVALDDVPAVPVLTALLEAPLSVVAAAAAGAALSSEVAPVTFALPLSLVPVDTEAPVESTWAEPATLPTPGAEADAEPLAAGSLLAQATSIIEQIRGKNFLYMFFPSIYGLQSA